MQPRHLAVAAHSAHSARRPRRTRIQFGSHRFDACAIFRMHHRKRVVQRAGLVFLASVADHIGSGIAEIQQTNAIRHLVERQTARNGVARDSQPIAQSLLLSGFLSKQIEVAEIARARERRMRTRIQRPRRRCGNAARSRSRRDRAPRAK